MTHDMGILGIFQQNWHFLKCFDSLRGKSLGVVSSLEYLQNGWQFRGLDCNWEP